MSVRKPSGQSEQPTAATNVGDLKEMDQVYEMYGRPLEAEHWGEFLAVGPDGQTMLGTDMNTLFFRAVETFGRGVHMFKVGEIAVGKIRLMDGLPATAFHTCRSGSPLTAISSTLWR